MIHHPLMSSSKIITILSRGEWSIISGSQHCFPSFSYITSAPIPRGGNTPPSPRYACAASRKNNRCMNVTLSGGDAAEVRCAPLLFSLIFKTPCLQPRPGLTRPTSPEASPAAIKACTAPQVHAPWCVKGMVLCPNSGRLLSRYRRPLSHNRPN